MLTVFQLLKSTSQINCKFINYYNLSLIIKVCLFLSLITGLKVKTVRAEGSRDLVENGIGDRPYTEFASGRTAGIIRQTLLEVYVNAGEEIYLGSSAPESANNPADIVFRSPFGGQNGSCDVDRNTGFGFIDTVAKETAGPIIPGISNPNGYIPCTFIATETGIYEVEFRTPSTGGNPPPLAATAQFPTDNAQASTVSAWDITVALRDASNNPTVQSGRVYSKYYALNLGANNRAIATTFFVLTRDGFQYEVDLNSIDPFGFLLFSNSRGFIDSDGSTLYRTARANNNALDPFQGGVIVQDPTAPDDPTRNLFTHLTFLNLPDPNILMPLGIPTMPAVPQPPANFVFRGAVNGSNNETFVGLGGDFIFDAAQSGSFQIIIDTNNNGTFGDNNDRVLRDFAVAGRNTVTWNGQDEAGNDVPGLAGNTPYNARITVNVGEYHFPLIDSESDPDGFVIRNINPPTAYPNIPDRNGQPINEFTIYYDDRNYTTANGTFVSLDPVGAEIATNPRDASAGINSSPGEHEFNNRYGDFKGIDTWTYFPSENRTTEVIIVSSIRGTKSVRFLRDNDSDNRVTVGDTVEYAITYTNPNGTDANANNFIILDTIASQLTYNPNSARITAQTAGNTITLNPNYNGTTDNTLTNTGTLRGGDSITITFTATINSGNGGNDILNQASATFSTIDNPNNTVLTDADSATGTANPPTVIGEFFAQIADDTVNIGNDPLNTADDDPTIIRVVPEPLLLLVKRITAIDNNPINDVIDAANDPNDTNPRWPANYLRGLVAVDAKPGDEIEYTIYYLSAGDSNVFNAVLCDVITPNQNFISNPTAFSSFQAAAGGSGGDRGIAALLDNTNPNANPLTYTNSADGDLGQFFPPNNSLPPVCTINGATNTNGAILFDLGNIPFTINPGNPSNSYGFIRFRTEIQ